MRESFLRIGLPILFIGLLTACERQDYAYGGRGALNSGNEQVDAAKPGSEPAVYALASVSHVKEVAPKPAGTIDGQALYVANCSACHQTTGLGVPGAFPPLDKSPYVLSDNVERMASIMIYGLMGPIKVLGTEYNSVMLPLGKTLNDEQLAAIATYIRGAWSNKASGVESSVFAKARQKWGERAQLTIAELGAEP